MARKIDLTYGILEGDSQQVKKLKQLITRTKKYERENFCCGKCGNEMRVIEGARCIRCGGKVGRRWKYLLNKLYKVQGKR